MDEDKDLVEEGDPEEDLIEGIKKKGSLDEDDESLDELEEEELKDELFDDIDPM